MRVKGFRGGRGPPQIRTLANEPGGVHSFITRCLIPCCTLLDPLQLVPAEEAKQFFSPFLLPRTHNIALPM